MGVTLTNLFHDWPRENIALASYGINKELCELIRPCISYFALDGRFVTNETVLSAGNVSKVRKIAKWIYSKLGASDFSNIGLSHELKMFIDDFKPDVIFTALGDIKRVRFAKTVHAYYPSAKLALYIVDDWPDSRFYGRWFKPIWRWKYSKAVQDIITLSDIRLSICKKMSDVYAARYGYTFLPFHNPVDLEEWRRIESSLCYDSSVFSIVYVGKINRDTERQLIRLAECVEALSSEKRRLKFDIYTPSGVPQRLREFKHTEVKGAVTNAMIPSLLKSYSLLFLTLGFSKETRNYVKLSMPTKLTEYLASETPILLYAPKEIALTEYLSEYGAAYTCTDEESLSSALCKAMDSQEVRNSVVDNARLLVNRHDSKIIRENFRESLLQEI